jgi:predicted dehydrogenase/nucleoside-diphosphate-sugar epimerase
MIPSTPPLHAAFVGAGQMARAHVRALRKTSSPVLVAGVYDADAGAAASFAAESGARAFASLHEMLRATNPDVVHVCTPAGMHHDATRAALEFGAHVYVEKPFVESAAEAATLLAVAHARRRLVCAGHQLLADPAFELLCARMLDVAPFVSVESRISFQSPTLRRDAPDDALVAQLIDILPHPLYALVGLLERVSNERPTLSYLQLTTTSIEAMLVAGDIRGRLVVDLHARPVASTLSVTGRNGTLTADFIRGCVTGLANPGTAPLEKAGNLAVDGLLSAWNSATGVVRRMTTHGEYPGLVQLFDRFHDAIRRAGPSPTDGDHLRTVASLHEAMATTARRLVLDRPPRSAPARPRILRDDKPIAVLTGASGFLGRHLSRRLAERGFSVTAVGRRPDDVNPSIARWLHADLSRPLPEGIFDDASIIVHAAAATSGGFDAHQRHGIDAAENVVHAAVRDGVGRLVHISSISVLEPPTSVREIQSERTPLAMPMARELGPYTWGKCVAESRVRELCAASGIALRVIRPGAFFDPGAPEAPGLVAKRLFGRWHLGLGRPNHPFAAIAIDDCAAAIAWCAAEFDEAPAVLNLFDPELQSREEVLARLRERGWHGRVVWFPISLLSFVAASARAAIGFLRKARPEPLAIWQVLRPRTFDAHLSSTVFRQMRVPQRRAVTDPQVAA